MMTVTEIRVNPPVVSCTWFHALASGEFASTLGTAVFDKRVLKRVPGIRELSAENRPLDCPCGWKGPKRMRIETDSELDPEAELLFSCPVCGSEFALYNTSEPEQSAKPN